MSTEIPFGFKRVWRSEADSGDWPIARILSLTGFRLFPTGPDPNRSAFKRPNIVNGLPERPSLEVEVGSAARRMNLKRQIRCGYADSLVHLRAWL
jgi:hypothetical protein